LISDSDVPEVGSARWDSTGVIKVSRKMNRHKTRPCCTYSGLNWDPRANVDVTKGFQILLNTNTAISQVWIQ